MSTTTNRPLAVVTGASSGIGLELARQFASHGFDLLISSQSDRIHQAAQSLQSLGTDVRTAQADLATFDGTEELYRAIRNCGRPIDAIAINAGVGASGDFTHGTSLQDELQSIYLNVISPVHLTKLVAEDMVAAGRGRILYTSSIAGTMPSPFLAVYGATKAFLTSFGQAIRNELKDTGVSVTVLMPGATDTDFFRRSHMEDTRTGAGDKDDPADVARDGFEALMAGKDHVVAGSFINKVQATAGNILPDPTMAEQHRKRSEPGSANR
jgi:short-subunit dehydrogenase